MQKRFSKGLSALVQDGIGVGVGAGDIYTGQGNKRKRERYGRKSLDCCRCNKSSRYGMLIQKNTVSPAATLMEHR